MITDHRHTRLTTEAEKLLVELGGGDPQSKLSKSELSDALTNAINRLGEQRSPILEKIYRQYEKDGKVPPLKSLLNDTVL